MSEPDQLTLDSPMAPVRILSGHPDRELSDRRAPECAGRCSPTSARGCDATPAASPESQRTPVPSAYAEAAAIAQPATPGR